VGLAFPDEGEVLGAMVMLDKVRVEKEINEKGEKVQRCVYGLCEGCACLQVGLSTYTSNGVLGGLIERASQQRGGGEGVLYAKEFIAR